METNRECPDELNAEFFAQITQILLGWMVGDAKKAAANEAYVGALVLGICALDVLGGLFTGVERTNPNDTFEPFLENYLPNQAVYIRSGVYRNMRNNLVHGYSTKGFKYTDEFPAKHLQEDEKDGDLWIHVDTFIWEVETAARRYLVDLSQKAELWNNFKERWEHAPLLGPIPD